jgi:hypothetical protein
MPKDPIFDIATEVLNTEEGESEVVAITPEPPKKVKKPRKQNISDERKEELKLLRIENLKKARQISLEKRGKVSKAKKIIKEEKYKECDEIIQKKETQDNSHLEELKLLKQELAEIKAQMKKPKKVVEKSVEEPEKTYVKTIPSPRPPTPIPKPIPIPAPPKILKIKRKFK